ncbi:metal ABC transporter ATP-binding protein [Tsukamurella sp. 8F]|uniref:metal ABC transporter ATP-binding protein n=1 Tax=unclassified Tsukamurella TaxID=2633480 RepID=UPI0023B8EBDE|nr:MULTISPECIES: metal ABC transporter ATP-binding protein [unclassified Tsukamurella]MDF0532180.1 metal ABC transporter ATP-binding protein [Tsukamurella sp. 8J]MDF0589257.1 metal ABC transporter ATP-binding protein [Tsukamurella sp. 8F]
MSPAPDHPVVHLQGAALRFGERTLWSALDLDIAPGEFVAILGPNGAGKTSLLRVLLGQAQLSAGTVDVRGTVGYIPQQRALDKSVPLRGRDLVGLGYDGERWGLGIRGRRERRIAVDAALAQVGAMSFADGSVGTMSGGEQQRLRVAQALASDPAVLLCDEPLLSLDPGNQQLAVSLIERRRRRFGTAVLFVSHEINPILPYVDRVLYLVDGRFQIGPTREVMTSEVLSRLYRAPVDVIEVRDRLVVVGGD